MCRKRGSNLIVDFPDEVIRNFSHKIAKNNIQVDIHIYKCDWCDIEFSAKQVNTVSLTERLILHLMECRNYKGHKRWLIIQKLSII